MTYPQIAFVDAPSETANVRLDLNSDFGLATCRVEHDSFTLGAPPLLGDSDSVSAGLGLRRVGWTLQINGPKTAASEVRSAVSKELQRWTSWVRFRLSATDPVHYLETYRGEYGALSLEFVKNDSARDVWRLPVTLDAEPLLLGEEITHGPYLVTQSPDGDYPMQVALPRIEGDAPTSLRVEIAPHPGGMAPVQAGQDSSWLVSAVSSSEPFLGAFVPIGTGDDLQGVTGSPSDETGPEYFNGSARTWTVEPWTGLDDASNQLWGEVAVTGLQVGSYRVQLRGQGVFDSDPTIFFFRLRRRLASITGHVVPRVVTQQLEDPGSGGAGETRQFWVDFGVHALPYGVDPESLDGALAPAFFFALDAGVGPDQVATALTLDAIKFTPISGPLVTSATTLRLGSPNGVAPIMGLTIATLDGENGHSHVIWAPDSGSDGQVVESSLVVTGAFPMADPAADHHTLTVMATDNGYGTGSGTVPYTTSPGAEADVTVSYHPRRLHP